MPVAFDELGRFDTHGAIIGGKGLIELGHLAPDSGGFLDKVHFETCGGEIKRGLNTADPSTNDQDISKIAVYGTFAKPFDLFLIHEFFVLFFPA
jgi:hypothetical protein